MMEECVFCNIINGSEKAGIVYEDELCMVVLDKYPLTRGHMLVLSRQHYKDVLAAPAEVISHMYLKAVEFSKIAMERLKADGINIGTNIGASAGQVIWHAHIHIIPRYAGMERSFDFGRKHEITNAESAELVKILKLKSSVQ
ncbi:MAG: HIT domain-containing protein [Candidatus Micrarchaeaceae archaeon]